jgi:hypothetical protein
MKYVTKILLLTTVLLLIINLQSAVAQPDIDTNRMNRDINIMENVLQELFKTEIKGSGDNLRIHSIGESRLGNREIGGTYVPGYGVIFNISSGVHPLILFQADDNTFSYSFQYGNDDGKKVTQETITNRIIEFLRDYGSTIGQISDDHQVMVIYKANLPHRQVALFRSSGEESKTKQKEIPTISVVANAGDLKAYRSGDINDKQLRNRLDITSVDASANQEKDLKVMAGILETAFENSDEESFEVRGPVKFLKLDNFGTIFSFDARYGQRNVWDFSILNKEMEKLRKNLSNLEDSVKIDKVEIKKTLDNTNLAKQKDRNKKLLKAYDTFLNDLKFTLADYGRTLRSVEENQQILVTVNLLSRHEDIPERIELQVQKSALENNSRKQAMKEIQVREY